jgi:hypothetical protein
MAVDSVTGNLAPQISGAIRKAAQSTGISFNYLLTTAKIESSLNPTAKASTSSATGLYQFIEQTWLGTVKQDGAALGLGQYADAISKGSDGRYTVADPATRQALMKLRNDPATSAMMAGALARSNAFQLTGMIGRRPTEGELYTAHFLGPDGAGRLVNAYESQPDRNAASMFPAAAAANRGIFYNRDGSARTIGEVYARLTRRFDSARTVAVAMAAPASGVPIPNAKPAGSAAPTMTVAGLSAPMSGNFLSAIPVARQQAPALAGLSRLPGTDGAELVAQADPEAAAQAAAQAAALHDAKMAAVGAPDTAGFAQAFADASDSMPPLLEVKPLFQSMFSDPARAAVTQRVASLWTPTSASAASTYSAAASHSATAQGQVQSQVQRATRTGRGLDLFTDSATDVRGIFHGRG